MSLGARAEIRLEALRQNHQLLRSRVPGSRVLAAVKANAYGHGIVPVSQALADEVDAFAVARLVEAETLRSAGIDREIVLMGGVLDATELYRARDLECDLVVHADYQVELLRGFSGASFRVWLKVDTGMHRLGIYPEAVPGVLERLRTSSAVRRLGFMTHLANADDVGDRTSTQQFERFAALADGFDGDVSVANSAALLGWADDVRIDGHWHVTGDTWIRPGVSLYGVSPLSGCTAQSLGLEPVMNFEAPLIAVKRLAAGERVGYGGVWTAPTDTVLGIAAAGYGDGYSRVIPPDTPVLVNGRRAGLAGVVSMDLLAVNLGADANDAIGDTVRLWGQGLPVEDIAAAAGTTAYALVTGVRNRDAV
ncbi:MAG: alanine racemase [Pseudomonadota bacterium]